MSWKQLSPDKAAEFIKTVASPEEPGLFEPSLCEVYVLPLSFYDGYSLYRIVNKHTLIHLLLDYVSNGEVSYYLDGSEAPFQNLKAQGALSLDVKNVRDYVDLYISYVYERGNSLGFIRDPHSVTHKGSAAMGMHFKAILHHQEASITTNKETGNFAITTPLIYQDQTVQAQIEVTPKGAIFIRKPVEVSFLQTLSTSEKNTYRHPHEAKLVEQMKSLLGTTEQGQKLLKIVPDKDVQVRVLCSPNYQDFVTHQRIIYILVPAAQDTADYMQALLLAGGLRAAEQIAAGYLHPHPSEEEELYYNINMGKNLDVALEMCKMVEEYEAKGIQEPLNELRKIGLEDVYIGYKKKLDDPGLMAAYEASLTRYRVISEEE